jgi:hypothetical protein
MKNLYRYFLAIAFVVVSIATAQAQSYKVNSSSGANVRKGPGTDQPVMGKISDGASVKVLERTNDNWVKVEYNGQTGYVASDLITDENTPSRSANNTNNNNNNRPNNNTSSANNRNNNKNNNNNNRSSTNSRNNNSRSQASSAANKNMGIGLRFGDPAGITFKKYNGNTAWEFNLGNSSRWGSSNSSRLYRHYDSRFYRTYSERDGYKFKDYKWNPYSTSIQAHWLKHFDFPGVNNLQYYVGVGPQARFTRVWYRYEYNGRTYSEYFTDLDLGVDGVIGLEYTFPSVPLSIFLDANIFVEVYDVPFWTYGQSGIGIRYNF